MVMIAGEHFMWVTYLISSLDYKYYYIYSALTAVLFLLILGVCVKMRLRNVEAAVVPSGKVNFLNIAEMAVESLYGMLEGIMGKEAKKHLPFLGSIFIYIFAINILGLIPGFHPATDNMNTNLGVGVLVFLYYNFHGLKEHGLGYLRHFLGPILLLGVFLIGPIEILGHAVRPLTLSVRLAMNITADHLVLAKFSGLLSMIDPLVSIGVPVIFMGFGIFVSLVQAFVFTLLSSVYVGMAISHDH